MKTVLTYLSLFALVAVLSGCKPADEPAVAVKSTQPPVTEDVHAHPEHGPHGGDLIELGKEAFHAELAHGDDGISIHILDGSATKAVSIAAEKLVVSLKHDGKDASFDLAANPDANDADGQTSRFTSTDTKLDEWLDAGATGVVVIEIEGKSYTGKVAHDHAGHDH